MKKILIAGANGFVGRHLKDALSGLDGYDVHPVVRSNGKNDLLDAYSLESLNDIDTAYYLVHGLKSDDRDFEYDEAKAALNFANWMKKSGCKKIIYLGALGPEHQVSPHLRSRHLVGEILSLSGTPCLEFRASIVIGAGSTSFEMIKALSERLPFFPEFKKLDQLCQPIALSDLMLYLRAGLDWNSESSQVVEIGGLDRITYGGLIALYLNLTMKQKKSMKIPPVDDRIFRKLLQVMIPEMADVGQKLFDSLVHETVVNQRVAGKLFENINPIGVRESMMSAIESSTTHYRPLWDKEIQILRQLKLLTKFDVIG